MDSILVRTRTIVGLTPEHFGLGVCTFDRSSILRSHSLNMTTHWLMGKEDLRLLCAPACHVISMSNSWILVISAQAELNMAQPGWEWVRAFREGRKRTAPKERAALDLQHKTKQENHCQRERGTRIVLSWLSFLSFYYLSTYYLSWLLEAIIVIENKIWFIAQP